jgi:hypothetical protein
MPRIVVLILLLAFNLPAKAQSLVGNWVGYLTVHTDLGEKTYPYEINIIEVNNQQIIAKTVTIFPNQNAVIASAKGNFSAKNQLLNIEEIKFDQIKIEPGVQSCLMNNLLSYQKINGQEVLQGTYLAKNSIGGNDCGTGSIYLRKDQIFAKIKPLKKIVKQKNPTTEKNIVKIKDKLIDSIETNNNNNINTAISSNASITPLLNQNNDNKQLAPIPIIEKKVTPNHEHILIPWVLMSRENYLVKKIITHSKTISFDVFDNGTIDNDTITIYDNKKMMIDMNRISYKAVHFDLTFNENLKFHEIIVVANNLGSVPPNTALIKYKDAKLDDEVFINTDFSKNAKIIIEYRPDSN